MEKRVPKIAVLTFLFSFLIFSAKLWAAGDAGAPGSFLNFGTGARSQAMGSAFTGLCDDVSAIYWNPAGLSQLARNQLTFFNAPLWEDTHYLFTGYGHPTKKLGTFGIGLINLISSEFEYRKTISAHSEGTFHINQMAFLFAYGRKFFPVLSAGLGFKIVQKGMPIEDKDYFGGGFGMDLGLLYHPQDIKGEGFFWKQLKRLSFGVNLQNLVPPKVQMEANGTFCSKETYGLNLKFGTSYCVRNLVPRLRDKLTVNIDLDKPYLRGLKVAFGGEYWFKNTIAFRLGYGKGDINFGLGFLYRWLQADYAFTPHDLGLSHKFSITLKFGRQVIELEEFTRYRAKLQTEEYYKLGVEHYRAGKLGDALAEWDKALIWSPDDLEIQKKVEEVSKEMEITVTRKLMEKRIGQAYSFYEEGKLIDSLDEWREVLKLDPTSIRAKEYIERIEGKLSRIEREKYLERVKEKKKGEIVRFLGKGDRLYEEGKYVQAIREWEKILKINPKHTLARENIDHVRKRIEWLIDSHLSQGKDFYGKEDSASAIIEFKIVLKFDSENKEAKEYIEKTKEQAAKIVKKVSRREIDTLYYEAADLYLKGKYEESINILNKILELDPVNENVYKLLEKAKSVLELMGKK
ncbi:hypothetical protein ES705_15822 [subsurface metagenome]|nr:PorV/PorQ family protein [Clostridia bacterium]